MSGTGKSTALAELARRGFSVVETDHAPWSEWSEQADGYVWNEELDRADCSIVSTRRPCSLSGTVSNQGRFYPRFDAVVLLSAPADVLLRRVYVPQRPTITASRSTSVSGSSATLFTSSACSAQPVRTRSMPPSQSLLSSPSLAAIGKNAPAGRRPTATQSSRLRQFGMSHADGLVGARRSPWNCDV